MEKQLQLCNREQSKKLRELGFNWETYDFYCTSDNSLKNRNTLNDWSHCRGADEHGVFSAPSVELALEWIRSVKGIKTAITAIGLLTSRTVGNDYMGRFFDPSTENCGDANDFSTYPKAASALLDKLIETLLK